MFRINFVLLILAVVVITSSCGGSDGDSSENLSGTGVQTEKANVVFPDKLAQLFPSKSPSDFVLLLQIGNRGDWEEPISFNSSYKLPATLLDDTDFKYVYALSSPSFDNSGTDVNCPFSLSRVKDGYIPLALSSREVDVAQNSGIYFSFSSADCFPDSDGDSFSNLEELSKEDKGYQFNDSSLPRQTNSIANVTRIGVDTDVKISYSSGDPLADLLLGGGRALFTAEREADVILGETNDFSTIGIFNGSGVVNIRNPDSSEVKGVNYIASVHGDDLDRFNWSEASYILIPDPLTLKSLKYHQTIDHSYISFSICQPTNEVSSVVGECATNIAVFGDDHDTCYEDIGLEVCSKGKWHFLDEVVLPQDCDSNDNKGICHTETETILVETEKFSSDLLVLKYDGSGGLNYIKTVLGEPRFFDLSEICENGCQQHEIINQPMYENNTYGDTATSYVSDTLVKDFAEYKNGYLSFITDGYLNICHQFTCKRALLPPLTNVEVVDITAVSMEAAGLRYRVTYRSSLDILQLLFAEEDSIHIDYSSYDINLPSYESIVNDTPLEYSDKHLMSGVFGKTDFLHYQYSQAYLNTNQSFDSGLLSIYANPSTIIKVESDEPSGDYSEFFSRVDPDYNSRILRTFSMNENGFIVGLQYNTYTHDLSMLTTSVSDLMDPTKSDQIEFDESQAYSYISELPISKLSVHINNQNEIFLILHEEGRNQFGEVSYRGAKLISIR